VLAAVATDVNVTGHIGGAELRNVVYVPGRMINLIV